MNKVLVAAPTYERMKYCEDEFFMSIKNFKYPYYDILIVENSEKDDYYNELNKKGVNVIKYVSTETDRMKRLADCRNKIIEYAIEKNYDYLLMMDADVIAPEDTIERLIRHKKNIITGLYFNYKMVSGVVKLLPIAWKSINPKDYTEMIKKVNFPYFVKSHLDLRRFLTKKEYESNELMEVLIGSAGCMLISKEVFRKTKYGIMDMSGKNATTTDDIFFFNQARKNGFDIFCDTGLKCLHYILKKYKKNENGEYVIAHKIETGDAPEDLSKILPESEYIK